MYIVSKSYLMRKRIVLSALFLIILVSIIGIYSMSASADSPKKQAHNAYLEDAGRMIGSGMFKRIAVIFGADTMAPTDPLQFVIVSRDVLDSARETAAGKIESFTSTVCQGLALFAVAFFCIRKLFQDIQRESGSNLDVWFQSFAKMAIGFICVLNYDIIINAIANLGTFVSNQVESAVSVGEGDINGIIEWIKKVGDVDGDIGAKGLLGFIQDAIVELRWVFKKILVGAIVVIMQLPLLAGDIVLYTIAIELLLRKVFLPLALADIVGEGARSTGIVYLKKYFALYLRVALCFVIAYIGTVMLNGMAALASTNLLEGIMKIMGMVIIFLTVSKLYSQTSGIANNVMGV